MEFHRKDKVNFKGNEKFCPVNGTYVWARNEHLSHGPEGISYYIEHPDGNITKESMSDNYPFDDGFERPHSKCFKEGLRYICVNAEEIELVNQ